jgi:hypothetical protein
MMSHVDDTFPTREPYTKSFIRGIIGLLFSEMPIYMSEDVTIVSGWTDPFK